MLLPRALSLSPGALGRRVTRRLDRTRLARVLKSRELSRYLENGFPRIHGWCGGPSTFLLLEVLTEVQPASCQRLGACEIGVYHGLFFIGMHNLCGPDARSLGIDIFEMQHLNVDDSGAGDRAMFIATSKNMPRRLPIAPPTGRSTASI